jgi:DNA-binding response OmpR family regulator
MKLLYLEQVPGYATLLRADLARSKREDCRLTLVYNPNAAAARLDEEDFDAILLDIASTGDNTLAACQAMSRCECGAPIVALTDRDDEVLGAAAIMAGARDCLVTSNLNVELFRRRLLIAFERRGRKPRQAIGSPREDARKLLAGSNGRLRVLQIGDDSGYGHLLESGQHSYRQVTFLVDRETSLVEAKKTLVERTFDVVLLDVCHAGSAACECISQLTGSVRGTPVIVLGDSDDEDFGANVIRLGADDYNDRDHVTPSFLARAILLSHTRATARSVETENVSSEPRNQPGTAESRVPGNLKARSENDELRSRDLAMPESAGRDNRPGEAERKEDVQSLPPSDPIDDPRRDQRHSPARPVMAIPVFPNGRPDENNCVEGRMTSLSDGGMAFRIDKRHPPASNRLVVGIEVEDGQWAFTTLEVRRTEKAERGHEIAGRFAPENRDLLRTSNLIPVLNPSTCRFTTGLAEATLSHWARIGILHPTVMDHVLVCPECHAVPTFRYGCPTCGSMRVTRTTMIHHYACAYVGDVGEFEREGELACPKCHTRSLVVGSDYEHMFGPYDCWDCGWRDSQLELVGHCRTCDLQFPVGQCPEDPLVGYHVERLDPSRLVEAN